MVVVTTFVAYIALFALLIFGGAGTVDWARGWTLWIVLVVVRGASAIALYRISRPLMEQRSGVPIHRDQPWMDRILLPLWMASFAALIAFASWDGFRGRLLPAPPIWLRPLGLIAFAAGWIVVFLVLRANTYAVTVVRHQSDRKQEVVDSGPYALVRHPMYASMILVMVGLSCWLGSTAGMLASAVPMFILAVRIRLEEAVLVRGLAGYPEYQRRVRWRLIPFAW